MTIHDRIATLDLSDLEGVAFIHRQDVAAPHEDYIIIEAHYQQRYVVQVGINWEMLPGSWAKAKPAVVKRLLGCARPNQKT